ncbi:MAG: hypothetical protein H8E44_04320 [Planctomycetes bacterium]|nr:hypothetical protein [Planctomycetota bacterium]
MNPRQKIVRELHKVIREHEGYCSITSFEPEGEDDYLDIELEDGSEWQIKIEPA